MELTREIVERIIREANIARKTLIIYPESHPTVSMRIREFFSLYKEFVKESPITLGIKSDGFQWEDELITLENSAIKEFHSLLKNHQILAIQLGREAREEDIKKFFKLVSQAPEKIAGEGGFRNIVEREKWSGISFVFLDFQLAEIKEEEKIKVQQETQESERDIILKNLLLQPSVLIADPSFKDKLEKIVKSTESAEEIQNILSTIESALQSLSSQDEIHGYKFLLSILSIPLKEEYALWLKELGKKNPALLKRIASNIPKRILIEALRILIEKGVERNELEVFHSLIFERNRERIENFFLSSLLVDDIPISMEGDYKKTLNDMMERIVLPSPFPELKEEALKELSDERLRDGLFKLDLEALEWDLGEEDFSIIVKRLLDYYRLFLQTAQFDRVKLIIDAFKETKRENWKNRILEDAISLMKSREIIKLLIESLKEIWGKEKIEEIKFIFRFIGSEAVPLLMEALIEEEDKYTRRVLIDLISELGISYEMARINLKSDKWYVVRNMLIILRNTGRKDLINEIIECTEHPHIKVKIEAIRTLSQLGYEKIEEIVLKYIETPDFELKTQVLSLVSSLRLTSLVPYLNNLLLQTKIKNENIPLIIALIRTLGDIGDSSSVPIIKKFIKGNLFYPKRSKLLRKEVYKSLDGYPYEEIKELVEKGLKSRDREIAEISFNLRRRATP